MTALSWLALVDAAHKAGVALRPPRASAEHACAVLVDQRTGLEIALARCAGARADELARAMVAAAIGKLVREREPIALAREVREATGLTAEDAGALVELHQALEAGEG